VNTCEFCHTEFEHSDPKVTVCRTCWYSGETFKKQFKTLIEDHLQSVNFNAGVMHTGGGCFCLYVPLGEVELNGWPATYAYLTGVEGGGDLPEDDGLSPEQRWLVGIYDDREDDGLAADSDQVEYGENLSLDEAMEYLFAWDALFTIDADFRDRKSLLNQFKEVDGMRRRWLGTLEDAHNFVDANEYFVGAFTYFEERFPERHGQEVMDMVARVEDKTAEKLPEVVK